MNITNNTKSTILAMICFVHENISSNSMFGLQLVERKMSKEKCKRGRILKLKIKGQREVVVN